MDRKPVSVLLSVFRYSISMSISLPKDKIQKTTLLEFTREWKVSSFAIDSTDRNFVCNYLGSFARAVRISISPITVCSTHTNSLLWNRNCFEPRWFNRGAFKVDIQPRALQWPPSNSNSSTCTYQEVRNVRFSGNLACFVF